MKRSTLHLWQLALLLLLLGFWYVMTRPGLLPNLMFENDRQAAGRRVAAPRRPGRLW